MSHAQNRRRHLWLYSLLAVALTCFGVLQNGTALAAGPAAVPGYVLKVDGVAVAGGEDPAELEQLCADVVEQYRTEHTVSAELINYVEIEEAPVSPTLPRGEAAAEALTQSVSVRVEEEIRLSTPVVAETEFRWDDSIYKGEYEAQAGTVGEEVTVQRVTSINGEEQYTKSIGAVTVTEAQPTVISMGTKERPEYMWPARGGVSSYFGNDHGRTHKGLDITGSTGTDIYASRGGKVIYAGWNDGGYGNLVVIAHDNGTQTYYGHNSSLLVHVGQQVTQGQHIAEMGSTGRSSGVHSHFEVRVGGGNEPFLGTPVNPMDYLG